MGLYSDRFGVLIKGQDIECPLFSSPIPTPVYKGQLKGEQGPNERAAVCK